MWGSHIAPHPSVISAEEGEGRGRGEAARNRFEASGPGRTMTAALNEQITYTVKTVRALRTFILG